jgi:hypothetical protein
VNQELYEERLGHVEQGLASVKADVRVLGHDLSALKGDVQKVGAGVEQLLSRDAKRPEPIGLKVLGGAAAALASCAIIVWWLIEHSPAVQLLDRRVSRLDDPEIGRVTRIEREMGWSARVTKAPD